MAYKWKITQVTTTENGTDLAASGQVKVAAVLVDDAAPNTPITTANWYVSGIDVNVSAAQLQTRMLAFFDTTFKNYLRAKQLEQQGQVLLNTLRDLT